MKDLRIIEIYAKALYRNIAAEKNLDGIISDFKLVIDVSNHSKNLMRALTAPIYNLETKFELLDNIFKAYPTNDILIRFLKILVKNNQIKYLNEIYQKSLQYILNGKGIEKAYLTSARPMNPEELKKTISILETTLNKKLEIEHRIDPSIIGGFTLHFGSSLYDISVLSAYNKLNREINEI